jgi:CRISPR-associated protein Csx14
MTSQPEAGIRLRVDPTNPGQFFACCGLLELADRLFGPAEGWFEDGVFLVGPRCDLHQLLSALVGEEPDEVARLASGLSVKPLVAPLYLRLGPGEHTRMMLDAWMAIRVERGEIVATGNPPWNFWSGQQTSLRIWMSLRDALSKQLGRLGHEGENLFQQRVPLSGRFGFDPGAAWNALDAGFSPNEQKIDVASSPAVELLAAIGVQRFRPSLSENRESFDYNTWRIPLSPLVAAMAASGLSTPLAAVRYRGRVVRRGSYAALGMSSVQGGDYE